MNGRVTIKTMSHSLGLTLSIHLNDSIIQSILIHFK